MTYEVGKQYRFTRADGYSVEGTCTAVEGPDDMGTVAVTFEQFPFSLKFHSFPHDA